MGRLPHWVEVKDPKAPAVTREAEEDWGKITCSNCGTGSKSRDCYVKEAYTGRIGSLVSHQGTNRTATEKLLSGVYDCRHNYSRF